MFDVASSYLDAGLSVLPAKLKQKCPSLRGWKAYQSRLPSRAEVEAWFANPHDALCIVAGHVSGNAEMIDFDAGGALFGKWCELVQDQSADLFERLVIERTQSGGVHVWYRCAGPVSGNMKLAQRAGDNGRPQTLIETRGEGGLALCAPTPGYRLMQGTLLAMPVLTPAEREILLQAAWSLNEYVPTVVDGPKNGHSSAYVGPGPGLPTTARPGDDFNARGDVRGLLEAHGWVLVREGENEHWRRPGKDTGISATRKGGVFYVFSSNAEPFEAHKGYSPFATYAMLEHGGDFAAAANALRTQGFGEPLPAPHPDVDLSHFQASETASPLGPQDPGPMPAEMLRVPGFISEVMDHTIETAAHPNQSMAFCGALALMAVLAGRKVRDPSDIRTNIYILGLAHAGAGKDWPRKVNKAILRAVRMGGSLGENIASGEGLQDALFLNPAMLFQTDEIDTMLQSISNSKDGRYETLMGMLLTMYSSSNSVFTMRKKAGKESPGEIDQPNLVLFGTAVPNHYYAALSERMLTNGLFARMLIVESDKRPKWSGGGIINPPDRVLSVAQAWADRNPGTGNLGTFHPEPAILPYTKAAMDLLVETHQIADDEYAKAEEANDPVGTTVWGRVGEQTRKLALLYAVSENHEATTISRDAVAWAMRFVMHQVRRMLFMAACHVAENQFHADCLKVIQKIRTAPGGCMSHSQLLKNMHMPSKALKELVDTLIEQGTVIPDDRETGGRPRRHYRLAETHAVATA